MSHLALTHDLTKSYQQGTIRALSGFSFSIDRGEFVGILGPNGAGKTTALHILLGLISPTSGEVEVFGRSPFKHRHEVCKRLNFCSAYGGLPANLTLSENLTVFSRLYNIPNCKQKIAGLLEMFEIGHLRNRVTGGLSSGEKTRLHLAKSLLNDPELLILDEPTASLDPDISDKVRKTLKRIQRERNLGVIYTSHNMLEVEALCDRILFIHHGKTIAQGTPESVKKVFDSHSLDEMFIKIVRGGDVVTGDAS